MVQCIYTAISIRGRYTEVGLIFLLCFQSAPSKKKHDSYLQWLVFFVSSTRSVHFFVHLCNIFAEVNVDVSSSITFQSSDVTFQSSNVTFSKFGCNGFKVRMLKKIKKGPLFVFFGIVRLFQNVFYIFKESCFKILIFCN